MPKVKIGTTCNNVMSLSLSSLQSYITLSSISITLDTALLTTSLAVCYLPLRRSGNIFQISCSHLFSVHLFSIMCVYVQYTTGQLKNTLPSSIFPAYYDYFFSKHNVSRDFKWNRTWFLASLILFRRRGHWAVVLSFILTFSINVLFFFAVVVSIQEPVICSFTKAVVKF